jgi:hypothetical protein
MTYFQGIWDIDNRGGRCMISNSTLHTLYK